MPDETLTSAVEKAIDTHKEEIKQDRSDVVLEGERDGESQAQTKTGEERTSEATLEKEVKAASELEAEQGKQLIRALKDPQSALQVIDFLATQAGYSRPQIQTKQDVRDASLEINNILEKNLGEEFKFLAPKLGPAIKETLETMLADNQHDNTADIRARLEKQELREIQNETAQAHVEIANEWFGSNDMPQNVIQAMSQAMDEFPPTDPNMAPDRYYRKIFSLVAGDLGLTKRSARDSNRTSRSSRNRDDEVARNLTYQNRGITPSLEGDNMRKMSLKDAVARAIEQVNQSSRK